MLGAIVGDIVGSVYEWDNIKTKDFPLFRENCFFTDDTVEFTWYNRVRYKKSLMVEILKVKTENKFISWQANWFDEKSQSSWPDITSSYLLLFVLSFKIFPILDGCDNKWFILEIIKKIMKFF